MRAAVFVLVLLVGVPSAVAPGARDAVQPYVLGWGSSAVAVDNCAPGQAACFACGDATWNVGGACFRPVSGETSVALVVQDVAATDVAGSVNMLDREGMSLDQRVFCTRSGTVPLAPGTDRVVVLVGPAAPGKVDLCPPGLGSRGVILARFA